MRPSGGVRLLAWGAALVLLGALAASRLELSYDLALFLPDAQTPDQRLLVERLGAAPGARFVLVAVPDEPPRVRALVSDLASTPGVERVLSDLAASPDRPPEPLWRHRFLLADMDWSVTGLSAALAERLAELGLGSDPAYEALVARDPALLSLDLLDALAPGRDRPWRSDDGRRVIVAVTDAPAFDLEAQARALEGIRGAVTRTFSEPAAATLSGAGVFGVELRETIRAEAAWRTVLASGALVTVLLLVYRSPAVVAFSALPLAAGLVCGTTAVALGFGEVHGITLAFGFTLLGVAIDYPLHFLSRARLEPAASALRATWPTLRLSVLSTGLAYAALMAGGARGMAQLGLFSAAGVLGAAATTRWVLPWLVRGAPGPTAARDHGAPRLRFSVVLFLALAGVALAFLGRDTPWWATDLSTLSPIPAERLAQEGRLRAATGAPNIRYQVALEGADLQPLLRDAVRLHGALEAAEGERLVAGFDDATTLLPPAAQQLARRDAIPPRAELARRLAQATAEGPFSPAAFDGFLEDAAASRGLAPLAPKDYLGADLEAALAQHLYQGEDGRWVLLATLRGDPDTAALRELLRERVPAARLVDLRAASEGLVADYRKRTLWVLGGVLLLIAGLLAWRTRLRRMAWTLSLVLASVFFAAALLRWGMGPLDLYQVTGLLLVAGLGLDYALFLGKANGRGARHAVFACVASTAAAFGILAASSIPALGALGSAVALGSVVCFSAAWLGARRA